MALQTLLANTDCRFRIGTDGEAKIFVGGVTTACRILPQAFIMTLLAPQFAAKASEPMFSVLTLYGPRQLSPFPV
jgi:hypothetical protein